MPSMTTTQIGALSNLEESEMAYDNVLHIPKFYNGTSFVSFAGSTPTLQQVLSAGATLTTNNTIVLGGNILSLSGLVGPPSTYAAIVHSTASDSGTYQVPMGSGAYVPALTNTTNITSSSADSAFWIRVGNTVTVAGSVTLTPTTISTTTQLSMSIPINSTFTGHSCFGVANAGNQAILNNASITSIASTSLALLQFVSGASVGSTTFYYQYSYIVH